MMEILSPAGGFDSVLAAVMNGADAVYLGQKGFSARQNAENFDGSALKEAVELCHLYGVKVYQTVNTMVFDEELPSLAETMKTACEAGVDALITQDLGVAELAKKLCPQMPLHGSTQMTVHTPKGAAELLDLGFHRVVLSREMTLREIEEVIRTVPIEVEVFVHGALCMSVSGQCYMSSAIGGRSGNKGSCAGSCRLPFCVGSGSAKAKNSYDLSLKDLCLAGHFKELEKIGVTSLKIEGRMKRPEYVAAATRAYRNLKEGRPADMEELRAVFSRNGFTDGYLTGKKYGDMFGFRGKEDVTAATGEVFGRLQETYRKKKAVYPVKTEFTMKAGIPSRLTMEDSEGHRVSAEGEIPQKALKKPTTAEMAKESLEKLGDTPYLPGTFTADVEEGLILPKSKLNELRRTAIARLDAERIRREEKSFCPAELPKYGLRERKLRDVYRARFASFGQMPERGTERLEYCYLPVREILSHAEELMPLREKIIAEPDRILFGREAQAEKELNLLREKGFSRLAVSNPAHLRLGRERGFTLFGTHFLNIANSLSAEKYGELGLADEILSVEGTTGQLGRVHSGSRNIPFGAVIYGALPLMILRNCPVKRYYSCEECRAGNGVTDRLGNYFPIRCNERKYSELFNCRTMDLLDKQEDFQRFDFLELYFTGESKAECERVLARCYAGERSREEYTRGLYYRGIV